MIHLQQFAMRRGGRLLFENASMQLHPGWKIGLTGVNGAGKSTLFAALVGQAAGDSGTLTRPAGWVVAHMAQEVESQDTPAIDFVLSGDEEWWRIDHTLKTQEDTLPIDDLMALHTRFGEIDGYTAPARAAQMMSGLGFTESQINLPVSGFSGGWRMRLNLARTLMSRSDLLLLDEPTNHLDLDAILWLEDWLAQYAGTLILISHDRDFLDAITDHIIHIEAGQVTLYTGNYSTFEQTRAERLAQQQQSFEKQEATRAHLQKYIDRFKAQATKARQAQSRIKQLERMQKLAPAHVDTPFSFQFREPSRMSSPLLRLDYADVGYSAAKKIVRQVNLQITPDSRIGLLGMNGAGKSTLIKSLVGVLPLLGGERIQSELLNLGYFAQHQMDALDAEASPMLALSRLAGRKVSDADLRAFLGSFGFSGERMDTPCADFSGGERARLALALIVWQKPNVLILDEPTNHLDLDMRLALSMALQDYQGAVVLVSHERQLIAAVCDELWVVHDGICAPFEGDLTDYAAWLRQARAIMAEQEKQTRQAERATTQQANPGSIGQPAKDKNSSVPVASPVEITDSAPVTSTADLAKPKQTNIDIDKANMPIPAADKTDSKSSIDKELQRKQAAQKREQLRPLRKKIEQLEQSLAKLTLQAHQIEQTLTDTELYDASRKAELLALLAEQQALKSGQAHHEEQLLTCMLELEQHD